MLEFVQKLFTDFFLNAHPLVQGFVLVVLLALYGVLVYLWVRDRNKYKTMRNERDAERNKVEKQILENERLIGQITELTSQGENLQATVDEGIAERGRLEQMQKDAVEKISKLQQDRNHYQNEWQTSQKRITQLEEIDASVWYDPDRISSKFATSEFVPLGNRRTRFLSFLNLKGGVGKTTLVANLAAAYATGILNETVRVLIVDLDFQGTLSNRCVTETLINERRRQQDSKDPFSRNTCHRLLDSQFLNGNAKDCLNLLRAPITETGENAWAIVAHEVLESADFRQQAQFVVQEHEVRFHHRKIFHSEHVFQSYDLVLFDCPPRVTTSVINALTTSDYVVLPTSLHPEDTEAVPRTLQWLKNLQSLPSFQARTVAVVLNRTYRGGTVDDVTNDEKPILQLLQNSVQSYVGDRIIPDVIRNHPKVAQYAAGSTPFGTTSEGHDLYRAVAIELYNRVRS